MVFRGPILAWSSLSRTAASSASGVGGGTGAPLSFAGLCVSLAGLCADRAVAVPPPEPITPPSISRSQSRRSRSADFDSASPWWTRMINQPFRARPRFPRLPQFQHIQRSRRRKQAHFRRALLAGSGLPGGARRLAASPLHHLHARIESRDATRFRETCTKTRGPPGFLRPASSTQASQAHSPPHELRCARLRRAKGSVRMGVDEAYRSDDYRQR